MTQKVGAKGQVVIPKELREQVGLYPGTAVAFSLDGDRVVVSPLRLASLESLGGMFNHSGMAEELLRDRVAEPR
ncbi:MAG: AbrB/MazE/SpoVT family DNA-binding domain-containing protein [Candidatus Dormibacteraceae bacterium]